MADQRFCLRWNNHQPNLVNVMTGLLNSEMFVDATIAAEGRKIQVHKVVLSACSSYFQVSRVTGDRRFRQSAIWKLKFLT